MIFALFLLFVSGLLIGFLVLAQVQTSFFLRNGPLISCCQVNSREMEKEEPFSQTFLMCSRRSLPALKLDRLINEPSSV